MDTDPRVDAYIAKAPPFARPLLTEIRKRIRKTCPAALETIKWNVPFYTYEGKLLASMAAFKKHAKFGVWSGAKPTFVDVTDIEELPNPSDFAESLRIALEHARGTAPSPPTRSGTATRSRLATKRPARATKTPASRATKKTIRKPKADSAPSGFPPIAKPAQRALDSQGISRLNDLVKFTEREIRSLHGMGPKALTILQQELASRGKSFRKEK